MKKLTFTIVAGIALLTGCSKDEPIEIIQNESNQEVLVVNQLDGSSSYATVSNDAIFANFDYSNEAKAGSLEASTEGALIPASKNDMIITWEGTHNANAIFGEAIMKQESPNSNFIFGMTTECVVTKGNEAVYGGIITKAKGVYEGFANLSEGWRVYFKVIDGDKAKGTVDQISNTILFASPKTGSLCNVYSPDDIIWTTLGTTDIEAPGYVVVKH